MRTRKSSSTRSTRSTRKLVPGMQRIRLHEPVAQLSMDWESERKVVADLCIQRGDKPRGVIKSNFNRDKGSRKNRGHVWTSAPEGAYVFTESYKGAKIEVVLENGHLEKVPAEDTAILWRRLELISCLSGLEAILQQVVSLQAVRLQILKETFPEIGPEVRFVRDVKTLAELPEPVKRIAHTIGSHRPWKSVVHLTPRKGTAVAVVAYSDRPGHHNSFAVAAKA